jgi:hypothetical protein
VSQADFKWKGMNLSQTVLKFKLNSKKFQIFELGQNRISKITFDFA